MVANSWGPEKTPAAGGQPRRGIGRCRGPGQRGGSDRWRLRSAGTAGAAGLAGSAGSITEWSIPFADSQPFQIAASGTSVFYLTSAYGQMLGRLDTEHDTVTEWPLSVPATSPGDIQVRPSDGAVFFTSATTGELDQFDPQSQLLRRWPLPVAVSPGDPPGTVEHRLRRHRPGDLLRRRRERRLHRTARHGERPPGGLELSRAWPVRLRLAPDGTIFFATGGPQFEVVRLDPTTGVFTTWTLAEQPLWGFVVDGSGDAFFLQQSADFQGLVRLSPDTGRLTTWATSDLFNSDSLELLSGHIFFSSLSPTAVEALNPAVAGTNTFISPSSEVVTPRTSMVTPTMTMLSGQGRLPRR